MTTVLTAEQRKSALLDYRTAKKISEELGVHEVYIHKLRNDSISEFYKKFRNSLNEKEYDQFEWATRIRKFCKRFSKFNKHLSEEEVLEIALLEYPKIE